jgi:zinc/manganese transport system permease protein
MLRAWEVASIVALVAGVVGFFTVLRGSAFVAHAIPNGSFAGAAGASLLGISTIIGLGVFALLGALGIGALSRRGRRDAVTALTLVLMLALGALFLSFSDEYAPEVYSLLFGEVLGISGTELWPTVAMAAIALLTVAIVYRPLLLSSVLPEIADARGVSSFAMEICFLLLVALASTVAVPVVGTLLIFSLMIGPPAAARSFTDRPGLVLSLSVLIALLTTWSAIALSYATDYPIGFFVGTISAACFATGRAWSAIAARRASPREGNRADQPPAGEMALSG